MSNFKVVPPDKDPVDLYFELQQEVYEMMGYVEDWKVIPLDDSREYYWTLYQNRDGTGHVRFAESVEVLQAFNKGEFYEDEIYTQRHLPKWVYRSEQYTMVSCDTHTDGNKLLRIFSNDREVVDPKPYRSYFDWTQEVEKTEAWKHDADI